MELRDFIVTPLLLIVIFGLAFRIRPQVTDDLTRRYFFPALLAKIIGALTLGFIYQFYYQGGDTFNFHTHGSRHVWEAFMDSPLKGFRLFIADGDFRGIYEYASRIYFFRDPSSYMIIRIATLFDLITFSSYSATAVLFSVFSFAGMWLFFLTFYDYYPSRHRLLAIASFFIPSILFWGSGILKDTVTLTCLGSATYFVNIIFFKRKIGFVTISGLLISILLVFIIKKFLLQVFIPAAITWILIVFLKKIRSVVLRAILLPLFVILVVVSIYFVVMKIGEGDRRYSIDNLAMTAKITAYDIRYWTGRDAGSGYSLGQLDGTWKSMIRLTPQAINVSLFRPYFWEVNNLLMLMSALESFILLIFTTYVLIKVRWRLFHALANPDIIFTLLFAITIAFAVGISTFNFGTLVRYKIPLLPFYVTCLAMILHVGEAEKG